MSINDRNLAFALAPRLELVNDEEYAERRASPRIQAADGSLAILYFRDGNELSAIVDNLSATGVCLILTDWDHAHPIGPLANLTLSIRTPTREFSRIAQVRWAEQREQHLWLGLAYIDHTRIESENHQLSLKDVRIDPVCAMKLPAHLAARRKLLPFAEIDETIHVACVDSVAASHLPVVERMLKKNLQFWEVDETELDAMIARVYVSGNEQANRLGAQSPGRNPAAETQTAAALTEEVLYSAYLSQASDIHIDPHSSGANIRFRVDGRLELHQQVPSSVFQELVSRLKVIGGLDIAEKRAPQDGRFSHQFSGNGKRIDVRVATLPTKYGERMTLRLLALNTETMTMSRLGLSQQHKECIEQFLRRSQGMMILTGPTGSGKTTTLYAAIRMLLTERNLNIMTVEDPIEYEINGVAQCEVDGAEKVSFSKALRSILRHDPDVVMIGEIRDQETASIAIKAALTGHLVLGTLHTNSSAATVTRLIDMGIEPYLVAATLRLVVAQRLIRRLCPYCRVERPLTLREALALRRPDLAGKGVYDACGCLYCQGKGYSGRIGLYELLPMKSEWARGIAGGEGESDLIERMSLDGIPFLLDDAMVKMVEGVTPVSEVMQIASSW